MSLLGSIISLGTRGAARRFEAAAGDPRTTQQNLLLDIVRRNAQTEYGRRHGFAGVSSVEAYQRQVPTITYESIKQDMNRVVAGASNVFTAEDPVMFARTSGTTGDPKYIPVTPGDRGQAHRDQMRTWLCHAQRDHRTLFDGKVVSLVSPAVEGHTPSGKPYGSTSGHIYKNMSFFIRQVYGVPYPVFEIEDYQAKYYAITRTALGQNVTFLTTANPSSILKMCETGDEFSEQIIRDIRDGTLNPDLRIEPELREAIQSSYRPDAARAKALEQMRERRDGRLLPGDYWPNLALIGCWKGGTVGHYLGKYDGWFRPDGGASLPVRDCGYLSSECRGSIPLSDEGSKGALTIASNFFEFVATHELESSPDTPQKWDFLTVHELTPGSECYIFVTTTSGLYRYDINDVIRVEDRYLETPEIVFLRKGGGMTSITGEKLSVNQMIEAFQHVSRTSGQVVNHFKAEADSERSRYVLNVEFGDRVSRDDCLAFLEGVDAHLGQINIEYEAKRKSARLHAPVLQVMREGWYERRRRDQVASGKRAFQAKAEVLSAVKEDTALVAADIMEVVEMEE